MQEVANQEFAARNPACNMEISAACESSFAPYRDFPSTPRSPIFQWPRFSYLLTKLITTVFNPGIPFAQYGSGTPNSKSAWNPLNMTVGLSKPLGEVSTLTRFVTSWSKDHNCFRDDLTSKSVKVATCFWPQKWYCALYTPSGGLTGLVWLDWFDVDFFRKPWFWPTIYIYISKIKWHYGKLCKTIISRKTNIHPILWWSTQQPASLLCQGTSWSSPSSTFLGVRNPPNPSSKSCLVKNGIPHGLFIGNIHVFMVFKTPNI